MTVEYKFLDGDYAENVGRDVNALVSEGWSLHTTQYNKYWAVVMVKES